MAKSSLLYVFTLLMVSTAQAQELNPQQPPPFQLVEKAGEPVRMVFADGRVATLMSTDNEVKTYRAPFQVTENLCNPQAKAPHCQYEMPYKSDSVNFVWTTNPDAARMGQKLKVTTGTNSSFDINDDTLVITNFFKHIQKAITTSLPPDRLVCDNYNWLPANAQKTLNIKVWSGETMIPNTETNANENRTFFSYSGVSFHLVDNAFVFDAFRRADTILAVPPLLDTAMMVVDDGAKGCQMSIGSSLQQIGGVVGQGQATPFVKEAPIFGNFEGTYRNIASQMKSFLTSNFYKPEMFQ